MGENWVPVVGFEKYYLVNKNGDVLSLRSQKLRKPVLNKRNGYLYLILCGDGIHKTVPIHRIVALAFVNKPNGCDVVNHKDENKTNNCSDNLEWCTKAFNNNYNGKSQRSCKQLLATNLITGKKTFWPSARAASEAGIASYKNISACCRGLRKTAGGFEWRFVNG